MAAAGQASAVVDTPSQERLELELPGASAEGGAALGERSKTRRGVLPPVPIPDDASGGVVGSYRVRIDDVIVLGNRLVPEDEIKTVVEPYRGGIAGYAELVAIRDAVTGVFREAGYATTRVVLLPQDLSDGILELPVVEGGLRRITVATDGRFDPPFWPSRSGARPRTCST